VINFREARQDERLKKSLVPRQART